MFNEITYSLKYGNSWKIGFSSIVDLDCYIAEYNLQNKDFEVVEVNLLKNTITNITDWYKAIEIYNGEK